MHPYGIDTNERRWVFIVLVPLSFWLSWGLLQLLDVLDLKVPSQFDWIFDPGSAAACFLFLTWFMDSYGWQMTPIRRMLRIRTPILGGDWDGKLDSSYFDFDPERIMNFRATIKQDWTRCQVALNFPGTSESYSQSASIFLDRINPRVIYTYVNTPDPTIVQTMEIHFGTAELDYSETSGGKSLRGRYYNGRGRGTNGRMVLTRAAHGFEFP